MKSKDKTNRCYGELEEEPGDVESCDEVGDVNHFLLRWRLHDSNQTAVSALGFNDSSPSARSAP